jgi:hypothetical protein
MIQKSKFNHSKEDYVIFNVEDVEGKFYTDKTFLLSLNESGRKKDFMISEKSLKEISKKFPNSVSYGIKVYRIHMGLLALRRYIKISRRVYPLIIGSHLKPMDTDCLESEF